MDHDTIRARARDYISKEGDAAFRAEAEKLLAAEDWKELEDRFYRDLEFGICLRATPPPAHSHTQTTESTDDGASSDRRSFRSRPVSGEACLTPTSPPRTLRRGDACVALARTFPAGPSGHVPSYHPHRTPFNPHRHPLHPPPW